MDKYTIILTVQAETGDYVASMPEVPEVHATGVTAADALANLEHTYELVKEAREAMKQPLPEPKWDWTYVTINAETWEVEVKTDENTIVGHITDML